jgi:hypothetical protein
MTLHIRNLSKTYSSGVWAAIVVILFPPVFRYV